MTISLDKPPLPEPDPVDVELEDEPGGETEDEWEEAPLSPREQLAGAVRQVLDLVEPRALGWSLLRGTGIILLWIPGALLALLKRATVTSAPAAKPPASSGTGKDDAGKDGKSEAARSGSSKGKGKKKTKKATKVPTAAAKSNWLDQAGLAVLVCAVGVGALMGVGKALVAVLRPYSGIVAAVAVLVWFFGALTADALNRPENDHDESAGEQDQEDEEEAAEEAEPEGDEEAREARWQAARERLRIFVEHRVAATAQGHVKGIRGKGSRVDDLLAEQQENGGLPGMDRKGMIELLGMAGITVRDQMSFRVLETTETGETWVKKNVPGVHVEDLTKDLGRRPNIPAHLVPSLDPSGTPISPPDPTQDSGPVPAHIPAQESADIPAARTPAE
ncbi:hypothetical protein DI272_18985 [Streptomyces sp. Act143]|uniref:hypothetical protein n=1 Tax=Streptomyces sp. Act143 TaxID=2200760 RepID=UPI000D67A3E9|nr:hypothetical protein [Streptomyces sp. Act143]PWI16019.1 hypothetical protein DI272_18985 [Streptomyces sp. Act143]